MFSSPETLILQARQQFDSLVALVEGAKNERIDRVEGQIFTELLRLGRTLLCQYVAQHGTGECGPTLVTQTGTWKRLEELHSRRYVSIFGELLLERTVYGTRAKQKIQAVPLDAQLGLPEGDFSYLLQRWLQERCLDCDYAESVRGLAAILGVEPSVRSVEEMTRRMAADVADFQAQQPLPKAAEQAEILVATADHKGVPMVRRDRPSAAADEDSERPGVKRAACAGAVYAIERFKRTPEDVVDEVRRRERAAQRPRPQGKIVWAEMRQEDEYLQKGYPIGSGVIEGACRHVIKDRMERAGMMWTLEGASALLRLRVVHTNDHWHQYQEFRILREQKDLYGETAPHALAA